MGGSGVSQASANINVVSPGAGLLLRVRCLPNIQQALDSSPSITHRTRPWPKVILALTTCAVTALLPVVSIVPEPQSNGPVHFWTLPFPTVRHKQIRVESREMLSLGLLEN